jgi:hypothetical protein
LNLGDKGFYGRAPGYTNALLAAEQGGPAAEHFQDRAIPKGALEAACASSHYRR